MATPIKGSCPTCGELEFVPSDIEAVVDLSERQKSFYRFLCPIHKGIVTKDAELRIIEMLVARGCELIELNLAPPEDEVEQRTTIEKELGKLTADVLIDFHDDARNSFDEHLAEEGLAL